MATGESTRIYDFLTKRGVKELLHFTEANNLESIAHLGILPRSELDRKRIRYQFNDDRRFDGKNHINLSVSNLNARMFYKFRLTNPHCNYVIFSLDPSLLKDLDPKDYLFTSTNAASHNVQHVHVEELFAGLREQLPENAPTDIQSEVLVKTKIDPSYINFIYVGDMCDEPLMKKINTLFPAVTIIQGNTKFKFQKGLISKQHDSNLEDTLTLSQMISKLLELTNQRNSKHPSNGLVLKQEEINKYVQELYLTSWFATEQEMKQIEKLFIANQSTAVFDTYALPSQYFEERQYDKSTARTPTYWQMQYSASPFDEKQHRTRNQLSALSVLEKIINRGRMTRLSVSLEKTIAQLVNPDDEFRTIRYAHQIQSALIELIKLQKLKPGDSIGIDNIAQEVADAIFQDIVELDHHVASLYNVDPFFKQLSLSRKPNSLVISNQQSGEHFVHISSRTAPEDYMRNFIRVQEIVDVNVDQKHLEFLLHYIFGFDTFRPNQIDGIVRALNHQDSIVLLPTGSGKSIVYQLLSLITPGVSFIVDPIVSLAYDQVDNLYRKGIDRVTELVADTEDKQQVEIDIGRGQYFMTFVSPERFQNQVFRNKVHYYARTNLISLIAIDEAHCVSEWGHDFRTAYLSLAQTCRRICTTEGRTPPPLLALTGTASASVLRDMQRDLEIYEEDAVIQPESFDRKEIEFRVINCASSAKEKALEHILKHEIPNHFDDLFDHFYELKEGDTHCGLIFCTIAGEKRWQNGNYHPYGTRYVQSKLNHLLPDNRCGVYNGKLDPDDKKVNARNFKNNNLIALSATKSYGMGIDKPNIRWAIHYGISSSIESYYQEAGRCARDGKPAVCWIILSDDYPEVNQRLLDSTKTPVSKIMEENRKTKGDKPWQGDDVSRIIFFHSSSFSGIDEELNTTRFVLSHLLDGRLSIPFEDEIQIKLEKTLYRLRLLGYVADYTIDHAHKTLNTSLREFSPAMIEEHYKAYIAGYQEDDGYVQTQIELLKQATYGFEQSPADYMLAAVETLLKEFTYKIVEEGRRIAMRNMLLFTSEASTFDDPLQGGEHLRKKIIDYLSTGDKVNVSDLISKATDLEALHDFLNRVTSKKMAHRVLTQTSRLLEAYPEHFGFYFVMLNLQVKYDTIESALNTIRYSLHYGKQSYGMDRDFLYTHVVSALCNHTLNESDWNSVLQIITHELGDEYRQCLLDDYESDALSRAYLIHTFHTLSNEVLKELADL
ncbi:RecQ family ATP-dependent DNA helicase [Exiguobacterium sp. s129]|uniref:RecQ family ATP-dependent DNA helicase n=1 Tax=Exiguobacterium sp. s129 TaxID=2751264 RepID=UPI001BE83582|nr:RecQ family ATP-dependent DNA helicase [Exiguobacterium sp. s129]